MVHPVYFYKVSAEYSTVQYCTATMITSQHCESATASGFQRFFCCNKIIRCCIRTIHSFVRIEKLFWTKLRYGSSCCTANIHWSCMESLEAMLAFAILVGAMLGSAVTCCIGALWQWQKKYAKPIVETRIPDVLYISGKGTHFHLKEKCGAANMKIMTLCSHCSKNKKFWSEGQQSSDTFKKSCAGQHQLRLRKRREENMLETVMHWQCAGMLRNTIQYDIAHYNTIQYSTAQHNIVRLLHKLPYCIQYRSSSSLWEWFDIFNYSTVFIFCLQPYL